MNQDLRQARKLTLSEQRLLRRHGRSAAAVMAMQTLLCVIYWRLGYFQLSGHDFIVLFGSIWGGMVLYMLLLGLGATLRFSEPSLSLPLIGFCTAVFISCAFYVDEFRLAVVMLYFAALMLVSFRLSGRVMVLVACVASASYAGMLWRVFDDRGVQLSLSVEALQWLVFSMISISFAITGGSINQLRNTLADKNRALSGALEQVREMAIRDDLTGLFNRGHLMEILERQKALADSGQTPFSVCYVDLDHFKQINDHFGHEWGDRVLKRFSEIVETDIKPGIYWKIPFVDNVIRVDGGEDACA